MVMRVSGFASGMDIDSIVSDMMKAQRAPLNKLLQKKQVLEWQRDDYRSMNTLLLNFRTNELTNMRLTTTYRTKSVSSSDESKVSATATSNTNVASYNISSVTKLAESEGLISGSVMNKLTDVNSSLSTKNDGSFQWKPGAVSTATTIATKAAGPFTLSEIINIKEDEQTSWSVKVNGVKYEVVTDSGLKKSDENQVLVDKDGKLTFNKEIAVGSKITVDYIQDEPNKKYADFSLTTYTSTGKRNEKFLISETDSLNTVISKVNNSKVGISMLYDSYTGKISLSRTETGKFNIKQENDSDTIENKTKVKGPDIEVSGEFITKFLEFDKPKAVKNEGVNAEFTINGLKTERNSNTFTIDGVTFTLKQIFEATNKPVTIGVSNDNTKVYDNIKGFIDKYNELIETIQKKTNETRNKDYQPLTDDEREGLSDKQQEKWEEIAKSGLLRRDTILTGVLSQMRTGFYSTVNNSEISSTYNQLAKIGISTSSNYLDGGKLVIDEAKLKAAIEADPNSIEQLFRGENGIVQNLTETVNSTMDKLKAKAGNSFSTNDNFTIGKELSTIAKRQESFENRLEQLEKRYWAQFTAMEQAIQRANSQSANLMQFFSN